MTASTPSFRTWTTADYQIKQWKNGGGTTEELLVFPNPTDYLWRMSVATIKQSGPFSLFPGYQRILVPLSGSIILSHDRGKSIILKKNIPYSFSGEQQTDCELASEQARDFNLIYKAGTMRAAITTHTIEKTWSLKTSGMQNFIYCIAGDILMTSKILNETINIDRHTLCELAPSLNAERFSMRPKGKTNAMFLHITLDTARPP